MSQKLRILIVGNDHEMVKSLKGIFPSKGYTAKWVQPDIEAMADEDFEKLIDDEPEVALLDLRYGEQSVLKLLEKIKERSPGTEYIFLTDEASKASAIEGVNTGGYGYVENLSDSDQLLFMIQRAIEKLDAEKALQNAEEALQSAEEVLEESEGKYRELFNSIRDAILITDNERNITDCNAAFSELFGYALEEVKGKKTYAVYNDLDEYFEMGKELRRKVDSLKFVYTINYKKKSGDVFPGETYVFFLKDHMDVIKGFIGMIHDISGRIQTEEALRESEEKFKKLFYTSPDAMALVDEEGRFLTVNTNMAERFGLNSAELEGKSHHDVMPRALAESRLTKAREAIQTRRLVFFEDEREGRHLQNYFVPIFIPGKKTTVQVIARDITESRQLQKRLEEMSLLDSLTGLYNRAFFEEEMRRLEDDRFCPMGIVVCDINGLKLINDTLGHDKGDELLKATADILRQCFRASDIEARIGGDEFAILLPQTSEETLETCRNRIRQEQERYNEQDPEFGLSISIGYAVREKPPVDMKELFKKADDAMYKEKLQQSCSSRSETIQALIKTLEARDFITDGHAGRLHDFAQQLGKALRLSEERRNDLQLLARFHDLGKVGIPDSILFKPSQLTGQELQEMRLHCEIGHRIALSTSDLAPIADFILKHHEWWDGQGYPLGIKGRDIPLECRILSIVDVYDAMTHDRPYKRAMSHEEAVEELRRCQGTQFAPELTEKFILVLEETSEQ